VKAPTGDPIKLMGIYGITGPMIFAERGAGAKAAAQYLNAHGGVAGRPVQIIECDAKADAPSETACAQQLESSGAVASVSVVAFRSTAIAETSDKNHIVSIGGTGLSSTDLLQTTVSSFPLTLSGSSPLACAGLLANAGARKLGYIGTAGGSSDGYVAGIKASLPNLPAGTTFVSQAPIPIDATDLAGPLKQVIDAGADGVVIGMTEPLAIALMKANNGRLKVCTSDGIISDQHLKELGPQAAGWSGASGRPHFTQLAEAGTYGAQFVKDMDNYFATSKDSLADPATRKSNTFNGWLAVMTFAQVTKDLKTIDRESVFQAFTKENDLEFPGLLPKIDFTKFQPVPNLARLFQPVYSQFTWDVAAQKFTKTGEINLIEMITGKKA
jgi:ABC-type branched-subunit amino acid transport system substrate-binding protein